MAGINAPASKLALITALQGLTGSGEDLEGVTVGYSYEPKLHAATREYVFFASKTSSRGLVLAMRGSGRIKREEDAGTTLSVRVTQPGKQSTQDVETRCAAIGAVIENYVAANHTLGVTGLRKAVITGYELTSYATDTEAVGELDYQMSFDSYLD